MTVNANYSISTSLTGDSGEAFLASLTEPQRKLITDLVNQQRQDLNEIVDTRRAMALELRQFMKEDSVDKDKVLALARRYGELDGEISYYYARAFSAVAKTLTASQKQTLLRLRNLDAKYTCQGAYLYSSPIATPDLPNTDFLFTATKNRTTGRPATNAASGLDTTHDSTSVPASYLHIATGSPAREPTRYSSRLFPTRLLTPPLSSTSVGGPPGRAWTRNVEPCSQACPPPLNHTTWRPAPTGTGPTSENTTPLPGQSKR